SFIAWLHVANSVHARLACGSADKGYGCITPGLWKAKNRGKLIPDVKPDIFGYCGKEPARRWGTYSDKVGITDKSKVFHSFRSTANNCLKQNGVSEEARCEFVGHDHDTINSKHYTEKYSIEYLFEHVVPKLKFDIDFTPLKYKRGHFDSFLYKELNRISKKEANKKLREERVKKNSKAKSADK
ncbi:hypothetical protein QZM26_12865, partial [Burkholderia multivorans]|nr:hypothetical protein [Burkholderia multivorans]